MASSSVAPLDQDSLVEGDSPSRPGAGNPSQGIQGTPGIMTSSEKDAETTISHLTTFTAVNLDDERKTSLVQLFHILDKLQIKTQTVQYFERPRPSHMKGIFCKNIFLKDRKGQFYYVICNETTEVDLKKLKKTLNAHRNFSFGSAKELNLKLALTPGAVSPFGLLNDPEKSVRVVFDKAMLKEAETKDQLLNFHPFVDYLTTLVSVDDVMKFVEYCGHEIEFADL